MPERAHTLICKLGADTAKDLAALLNHMAWEISAGQLTQGCSGGPNSGSIYSYKIEPDMTHDEYFRQLEAELEAKRQKEPADG